MVTLSKDGKPIIEAEAKIAYDLAFGPTWYRFFEGLKKEQIWGTKCPKCHRVLVPARTFCPRCFVDMDEWVKLSSEGVITGWALIEMEYFGMPTPPPFVTGVIKLDGADCSFNHIIGGFDLSDLDVVRATIKNGMRVKAVWDEDKTGCIMDIKHFKPIT